MKLTGLFRKRRPFGMREYDVDVVSFFDESSTRVLAGDACDAVERTGAFNALCARKDVVVRVVATGERLRVKINGLKVVLA